MTALPPRPTTYKDLCSDPDKNGLGTGHRELQALTDIYNNWGSDGANVIDDHALLEEALLDDQGEGMIGGILFFRSDANLSEGGEATVLHNVRKYTRHSSLRGTVFGYINDVEGQDLELTRVSVNLFETVGPITISDTDVEHAALFQAAGANDRLVDPLAPGTAGTRDVTTRRSMFIPFALVPHVMVKPPLNPRQAFETLVPIIKTLNLENVCKNLIDYLMVASTRDPAAVAAAAAPPAGGGAPAGAATGPQFKTLVEVSGLRILPAGTAEVAQNRRETILYRQLPAIQPTLNPNGADPALAGILGAVRDMREGVLEDLADRRTTRLEAKKPLTVEERFKDKIVDRLCKLCGVMNVDDLPPLYSELAAHKKVDGTVRTLIQEQVEAASVDLGIPHVPLITVQHATALSGWVFFGQSNQSLGEGLLPFSVIPPNQSSPSAQKALQAAHEENLDHHTVMTGSTSITSSDASKMRGSSAKTGYLPSSFEEMIVQVTAYTCLLGALLGTRHPNVIEHKQAVKALVRNQSLLKQFVVGEMGVQLGAATIVYYFQLRHKNWFQQQWLLTTVGTLDPPKLREGFETFENTMTTTWLPRTSHVDCLHKLRRPTSGSQPASSPTRSTNSGGSNSTSSTEAAGRTRVNNRNRDPRVMGENPLARRIREKSVNDAISTAGSAPLNGAGDERCLSWHLKGKCFSDCPRKGDHVVLPTAEANDLIAWCEEAYPSA